MACGLRGRHSLGGCVTDPARALIDECQRQSENCGYTSTTFTIWLRWLRRFRTLTNVTPVVFGALATWKIVEQGSPVSAAVCTFLATIIPPVYLAAKGNEAIAAYTAAAGEFANLRDQFRLVAEGAGTQSFAELEGRAKPLFERLERARSLVLTPPEWCFIAAQRKYKAGDYRHDYDEHRSA